MVARAVEQAEVRLRELRVEAREHLGLAALAFGLALAASALYRSLAVPFLFGGFAALFLFVRALTRRFDLIDRLVVDRDAYLIPEIRKRAEEAATMQSRLELARLVQAYLHTPEPGRPADPVATELEELAAELEDEALELDPGCAVACSRLFGAAYESPLYNRTFPASELRSRIVQIRAGFEPRERSRRRRRR
jgi:hypothetical protein